MAEYGIPYMGSKGKICNELIRVFPKAENFYDIFGGGFSVTHAMLLRRPSDYKHFHFNEIRPGICDLIKRAIAGEFNYNRFKPPFVSRDEFFKKFESDPYIKIIWSFGNNGQDYLFSKEIEPYKKSLHNAIIFNEFDDLAKKTLGMDNFKAEYSIKDRRLFLRNRIRVTNKDKSDGELQQLERLQQLQRLERLEFYNTSYENIKIKDSSVVYCDPPYAGTAKYDDEFNHSEFFDWCDEQSCPVFISEYNISDKRFTPIKLIKKRSLLSSGSRKLKNEMIYVNRYGLAKLREAM